MPRKPLPEKDAAHIRRVYLLRHELLTMVPFSMASIHRLEARGVFPQRVRLEPTNRVAWSRREVERFLAAYAKRRPARHAQKITNPNTPQKIDAA